MVETPPHGKGSACAGALVGPLSGNHSFAMRACLSTACFGWSLSSRASSLVAQLLPDAADAFGCLCAESSRWLAEVLRKFVERQHEDQNVHDGE